MPAKATPIFSILKPRHLQLQILRRPLRSPRAPRPHRLHQVHPEDHRGHEARRRRQSLTSPRSRHQWPILLRDYRGSPLQHQRAASDGGHQRSPHQRKAGQESRLHRRHWRLFPLRRLQQRHHQEGRRQNRRTQRPRHRLLHHKRRQKGNSFFLRRPYIPVDKFLEGGSLPTAMEAQAITKDVFSFFVSEEVDKVELLYTKFVSLVKSDLVIHTLLPLSPKGEICDINGNCIDAAEDEFFRLTMKEGNVVRMQTANFSLILQFKQDPVQILDALPPLYLNSQESLASELSTMSNATDNAIELNKTLSIVYNRQCQAKITSEILEIVAGANALV